MAKRKQDEGDAHLYGPKNREQQLMMIAIQWADDTIGVMSYVLQDAYGRVTKEGVDADIQAEIDKNIAQVWTTDSLHVGKLPIKGWWNIRATPKETAAMVGDRTYRSAWRFDKDTRKIYTDMDAARIKHMDLIRIHRDKELRALDVEWMKAMGQNDQVRARAIETERQRLRDIPQTFDLSKATTPEELKSTWPSGVTNRWTKQKV